MMLLDTHAWIWWISNPELLSQNAIDAINSAISEDKIYVSSISVWEASMLVEKHRLSLKIDFEKWLEMNELIPYLNFVPVNNKIAFQSTRLLGDFHADPADRIIVATAIVNDWKLITKDKKILDYNYVESIW